MVIGLNPTNIHFIVFDNRAVAGSDNVTHKKCYECQGRCHMNVREDVI